MRKKIKVYKLMTFGEDPKDTYEVEVVKDSTLVHMKVLHDGVYAWYEVPVSAGEGVIKAEEWEKETQRFKVVREGDIIPEGAWNVAVLDIVFNQPSEEEEGQQEQAMIIFNIYQLKN